MISLARIFKRMVSRCKLYGLFVSLLAISIVSAQATCSAEVEHVLATVADSCSALGRNEVCYGNDRIDSEITDNSIEFSHVGNMIPVDNLISLQTYPLANDAQEWGIAVFRLQAIMEGTLPGQVVTIVTFGDVEIAPDAESADASTGMMQAFSIRTGIGTAGCDQIPDGGVLLQNSHGERVNLTINGVELNIGSTAFFTAEDTDSLAITTLDGNIKVSANDTQQDIPAGFQLNITTDEPLTVPEIAPEIEGLPTQLLPEPIPQIGEPSGEIIGLLQCSGSGGVDVAAGSDIYLRGGWADYDIGSVIQFAATTPPTLSLDGTLLFYSHRAGPDVWSRNGESGFAINWYWAVENVAAGTHQAAWVIDGQTITCSIRAG